jgi:excisionase family DNA binding protein
MLQRDAADDRPTAAVAANPGDDPPTASSVNQSSSAPWAVDAAEAARLLGISRAHFLRLHAACRIPEPVRIGRCVRWNRDELQTWFGAGAPAAEQWQVIKEQAFKQQRTQAR